MRAERALLAHGLLIAAILALAGACSGGGSDEAEDGVPDATDRGTVTAQADAYRPAYEQTTERYADGLEEVQEAGIDAVASDPVGAYEVYDALRAVTEDAWKGLDALSPPSDLTEAHDRVVDLLAEQVAALTEAVAASQARDDRALETHLTRYAELLAAWREAHSALTNQLAGV